MARQSTDLQNNQWSELEYEKYILRAAHQQLLTNFCTELQTHLEKNFKAHFRLYQVLYHRKGPPTPDELALAHGTKTMDADTAAAYKKEVDKLNQNIKTMFEKQAAAAEASCITFSVLSLLILCQEPWDQQHFEGLIAKWVAVCDQPFTAVNAPEFREMLQYAHRKPLQLPHHQAVKERIEKMSKEMQGGLKKIFAVRLCTTTDHRNLNRCCRRICRTSCFL